MNRPFPMHWSAMLDRTAAAATERFRTTRSHRLYLWYQRSDADGSLQLRWNLSAETRGDGYKPVTGEPLTDDVPVSSYPQWLNQHLRAGAPMHRRRSARSADRQSR